MTRLQAAYERTEPRQPGEPVLCAVRITWPGGTNWRSRIRVYEGDREHHIVHGYFWKGSVMLAIPMDAGLNFAGGLFEGDEVPWERAPKEIGNHILYEIAELEA